MRRELLEASNGSEESKKQEKNADEAIAESS
jgi:hypothetical protein